MIMRRALFRERSGRKYWERGDSISYSIKTGTLLRFSVPCWKDGYAWTVDPGLYDWTSSWHRGEKNSRI